MEQAVDPLLLTSCLLIRVCTEHCGSTNEFFLSFRTPSQPASAMAAAEDTQLEAETQNKDESISDVEFEDDDIIAALRASEFSDFNKDETYPEDNDDCRSTASTVPGGLLPFRMEGVALHGEAPDATEDPYEEPKFAGDGQAPQAVPPQVAGVADAPANMDTLSWVGAMNLVEPAPCDGERVEDAVERAAEEADKLLLRSVSSLGLPDKTSEHERPISAELTVPRPAEDSDEAYYFKLLNDPAGPSVPVRNTKFSREWTKAITSVGGEWAKRNSACSSHQEKKKLRIEFLNRKYTDARSERIKSTKQVDSDIKDVFYYSFNVIIGKEGGRRAGYFAARNYAFECIARTRRGESYYGRPWMLWNSFKKVVEFAYVKHQYQSRLDSSWETRTTESLPSPAAGHLPPPGGIVTPALSLRGGAVSPGFVTPAPAAGFETPPAPKREVAGGEHPGAPRTKKGRGESDEAEVKDEPEEPEEPEEPGDDEGDADEDDAETSAAAAAKAKAEAKRKAAEREKKKAKDFAAKLKSFVDLKKELDTASSAANRMLTASAIDEKWDWASHDGFCQPIRNAQNQVQKVCKKTDLLKHWTLTSPKEWPKQVRQRFKNNAIESTFKHDLPALKAAVQDLQQQVAFLESVAVARGVLEK